MKKKKFLTALLLICISVMTVLPCSAGDRLMLIAHRGFSSVAPENTLAAVKEAGMNGFYGCEFDIRLTKDNVWVVSHDNTLKSISDSSGTISSKTYDEIKDIKITKGNGIEDYPNETIPTLTEMLNECAKWKLHPVIEIKDGNKSALADLCSILNSRPEKAWFTIISFNKDYLTAVKTALPEMECLFLTNRISSSDIDFVVDNNLDGISFDYLLYDKTTVDSVKELGLSVNAWTVDDIESAKMLYADGITSITTNEFDSSYETEITGGSNITSTLKRVLLLIKNLLLKLKKYVVDFFKFS